MSLWKSNPKALLRKIDYGVYIVIFLLSSVVTYSALKYFNYEEEIAQLEPVPVKPVEKEVLPYKVVVKDELHGHFVNHNHKVLIKNQKNDLNQLIDGMVD